MSNPKEHTDADGEGGGIYINITIPPGVEPGVDSLTFQYEGNEMEIQVPEDSVPGDVLSIKVGCTDAEDSSSQNDRDGCSETMKKPSRNLSSDRSGLRERFFSGRRTAICGNWSSEYKSNFCSFTISMSSRAG